MPAVSIHERVRDRITIEDFVEIIRPLHAIRDPGRTLASDVPVEDMCEAQIRLTAENVGHRASDSAETQERNIAGRGLGASARTQGRSLARIVDSGKLSA
jgi:hypothetical protein